MILLRHLAFGTRATAGQQQQHSFLTAKPRAPPPLQMCVVLAVYDPDAQQVLRTQELHTGTSL